MPLSEENVTILPGTGTRKKDNAYLMIVITKDPRQESSLMKQKLVKTDPILAVVDSVTILPGTLNRQFTIPEA